MKPPLSFPASRVKGHHNGEAAVLTEEESEHLLGKKVVGTTLKVYLHLLRVKQASARQVYRSLEMSSPYLAEYHLNKLNHLRLAERGRDGLYHANPKRFGILSFFVVTGKWIVPRAFFYALFFLAAGTYLLCALPERWNLMTFALMLIPTVINATETVLFYKALSRMSEK